MALRACLHEQAPAQATHKEATVKDVHFTRGMGVGQKQTGGWRQMGFEHDYSSWFFVLVTLSPREVGSQLTQLCDLIRPSTNSRGRGNISYDSFAHSR